MVYHYALFCFQLFEHLTIISSKNSVKVPLLALHLPKSCTEALTCVNTAYCHLRGKGEMNGVQRRAKVSFGRTMMQALELLWLAKRHISGRSDVEQ